MKRILTSVLIFLFMIGVCLGAGSTSVSYTTIKTFQNQVSGVTTLITATADATTALFVPLLLSSSSNDGIYKQVLGKWLTSARTTPAAYPAPTANYDVYIIDGATATSEHVLTSPTLAIGTDTSAVSTIAFNYIIDGAQYYKAAVAAGTEPGNDVVPINTYGAVALDIGANGTIDIIEAAANATGYASAALAIAGVAAAASDHVRLGYVTAIKTDGAFTFGTTALSAANSTVTYVSTVPAYDVMGGRMVNRSATAAEEVYASTTDGDNAFVFIKKSIMVVIVNNSVNSAVVTLEMTFN